MYRWQHVLAALALVACATGCSSDDPTSRLPGGGKADDLTASQSVCGIEVAGLEHRGVGEIGERDLDPRLTANTTASSLNASLDCVNQIDTCFVPGYFITEDETTVVVTIENTELVGAKLLFVDFELVAEERAGGCVRCEGQRCPDDRRDGDAGPSTDAADHDRPDATSR